MECDWMNAFSLLNCTMRRFLSRFRWHLAFWILYCIFWTWISASVYHSPPGTALLVTLTWLVGQATMIYCTIYRWMPLYFKPRRMWTFFSALAGSIVSSTLFTALLSYWVQKATNPSYPYSFAANLGYVLLGNLYWAILATFAKVFRDRLRNDRRNQLLEKEHTENELRFLKSQMNPHFLFNAINSIYVLIRKDPGLAEHTLARFSDMLRYQLYDCTTDYIPIEKEITYLENYIRLEQLRKGPMLSIDFESAPAVRHFSVAPLLLMPLVENAFKFVSSYTDQDNQVRIGLYFSPPEFRFEITNTVDVSPAGSGPEGNRLTRVSTGGAPGGIGLENVRRRLELLYPKRHVLQIEAAREYYSVSLKIQLA